MWNYEVAMQYKRDAKAPVERAHSCKKTRDEALLWLGLNVGLAKARNSTVVSLSIHHKGVPVALPARTLEMWRSAGLLDDDD